MEAATILIVKFATFYWPTVSGGPRRITAPNFVQIGRYAAEILQFFKFSKNGRRRHLVFLKFHNFIGYLGGEDRDVSACKKFRQNR